MSNLKKGNKIGAAKLLAPPLPKIRFPFDEVASGLGPDFQERGSKNSLRAFLIFHSNFQGTNNENFSAPRLANHGARVPHR